MKDILAIILIVVTVVIGYLYVYPAWQEVDEKKSERAAYEQAIQKVEEFKRRRAELLNTISSFQQDDLRRLTTIMPDNRDSLWLLMKMDKILEDHDIDATDLALKGAAVEDTGEENNEGNDGGIQPIDPEGFPYETTAISFSFEADYQQMKSILSDLQRQLPLLDITSLSFETSGESNVNTYNVTMHTYSLQTGNSGGSNSNG